MLRPSYTGGAAGAVAGRRGVVLIFLGAIVAASSVSCQTTTSIQRDAAARLRPRKFASRQVLSPPYDKIQMRVYATEAHRRAVFGWQVRFLNTIKRANAYLGPTVGVELEVVSARPWDLEMEPASLEAGVQLLMRHDGGAQTDLVVGLFSPLPAVTSAIHRMGLANLLGRHMVLRTFDSLEEMGRLVRVLSRLDREEVERLYVARRDHFETQLVLHEIAHVLGALHVRSTRSVLYPNVDSRAAGYEPETVELMLRGLKMFRDPGRETFENYRSYLASSSWDGWLADERSRMVAFMDSGRTAGPRGLPDRALLDPVAESESPRDRYRPRSHPMTAEEVAREALARAAKGQLETGWAQIEPLAQQTPDDPYVTGVACQLAARAAPKEAFRWCEVAQKLAPGDPRLGVLLAYAALRRALPDTARLAQRAEAQLTRSSTTAEESWSLLAQVYRGVSWVTAAERAAAKGGQTEEAHDVEEWASRVRDIYGLPRDAARRGVSEAAEAAYVRRRADIMQKLPVARSADAERMVSRFERRYPKMPPLSTELCERLLRDQRFASAEAVCRRAARRAPKDPRVQFALGAVAFARGSPNAAIKPLERALELSPDRKDGYTLLWSAYRVTGRTGQARRLAKRYADRFGESLPGS